MKGPSCYLWGEGEKTGSFLSALRFGQSEARIGNHALRWEGGVTFRPLPSSDLQRRGPGPFSFSCKRLNSGDHTSFLQLPIVPHFSSSHNYRSARLYSLACDGVDLKSATDGKVHHFFALPRLPPSSFPSPSPS